VGLEYVAKLHSGIAPCKSNQEFGHIGHNSVVSSDEAEDSHFFVMPFVMPTTGGI
jgi:hypothetical protein